MSLVVLQLVGQLTLVTQSHIVKERNTCNPVTMFQFTMSLNVILSSGEVPHEVTPIHEVTLIGKEEEDVLQLRGHVDKNLLSTTVVRLIMSFRKPTGSAFHPVVVSGRMTGIVHSGEEHILGIYIVGLTTNDEV